MTCSFTFILLLLECRSSTLRSDDHTLFLWKADRSQLKVSKVQKTSLKLSILEQEEERFMSILAGPPANNPSHSSVKVVMGLETTPTQHIIYPSTSVDSTEDYFRCVTVVSMVIMYWHCLLAVLFLGHISGNMKKQDIPISTSTSRHT